MVLPGNLLARNNLLHWFLSICLGLGLGIALLKLGWILTLGLVIAVPFAILFISHPFLGVITWLLVMPFTDILPSSNLIYWLIHRVLIGLTLIMVSVMYFRRKRPGSSMRLKPSEWAISILVGLGIFIILVFQTDFYWPLIRFIDRFVIPLFIFLIIRLKPLGKNDLKLLEWTILFIAISQSAIGIVSVIAPGFLPTALKPLRPGYASGTLANPNVYAIVLLFCGLFLFRGAMLRKPDWIRSFYLLLCGLCAIGIFLSMERAAWLALAMVLLGLLRVYPKMMSRVLLVGGLVILGLVQTGVLSNYIERAADRLTHEQPVYDRIVVMDAMLQMIQEKPLFGWGYETLNNNITSYYRMVGDAYIPHGLVTSHHTYLTIATESGLIIAFLYLFPMLWLFILNLKQWRWIPEDGFWNKNMLIILWLITIAYFSISNFLDMRWFPYGISIWWITLALIANMVVPIDMNSK